MLPTCEHHRVDGWHVPTQEAAEHVRRVESPYGWRDQLRAEFDNPVSRWMWPGLAVLLAIGLVIDDYLMITLATAALIFFIWQSISVVRAMRRGTTLRAQCSELELVEKGKKNKKGKVKGRVWHARTRFDGEAREVMVVCPEFEKQLEKSQPLELLVMVDPNDSDNHWLVGYRAAQQ